MCFSRTKYFNDHSKYSLKWFGWKIIKTIFTPPPLLLQHHYVLRGGGVLVEIQGNIFFNEFWVVDNFPCRELIKLSIHIWHDSKMNPFLYRKRIFWCDACIVYRYNKTSNAFSPLCIFELKVVFRYHFLSHFFAELNEICCGSLLNSILKTHRRTFL